DKPKKYQITNVQSPTANGPSPTIIPAHGYLVIWCDKLTPLTQLHASFKLAAEGGDVLLMARDESWSDRLTYTAMNEDQSVGRYPDGASDVFAMNIPTISKANMMSSYLTVVEQPSMTGISDIAVADGLSVHYVNDRLVVDNTDGDVLVSVTNLSGQKVMDTTLNISGRRAGVDVSQLRRGVYVAVAADGKGNKGVCKFVKLR
ncbi:MAG: T9SS type A sorting domain-containing protein, partial [Prevotella sp.]|nr:T9SS type A sorting domain-containing protein [Prevotella sp.]